MRFTRIVALALVISTLSSSISFAATWNQENGIWYCDTKGWVGALMGGTTLTTTERW